MMRLLTLLSFCLAFLSSAALGAEVVPRATFTEVTSYGDNPTGTRMWLYVPNNLAAKPAVVVGIHWCSGSASAYYQGSQWARYAETYGYIVIYPQTPYTRDNCWDVASKMTLTHNGGGASNSIANMVKFVIAQYGADASKVFATGISSGAMMTNVLAATYPDIFAAGIAYAGVPAGCFMSAADVPDEWNSTCSTGQSIWTQQQWANVVYNMYPGYTGARPKMQIYHGTADEALNVQNYYETIKQWTGVFGYSTTPQSTTPDYPRSPYTRYVFGEKLQVSLGKPGDLDGRKPDDDDAADEHHFDGEIDDDDGGRRVRDGTAMGPMRRHQLDGTDFGELMEMQMQMDIGQFTDELAVREPVHLHQGQ
ncbi:hypothetical protein N0V92_000900 [Colletotrichum tropicale]|nr:hypothetical protein N0V92_000900 [Colletotrichum tropicale]